MISLEFNIKGYTELFTFENNLKNYLRTKMETKYGSNWLKSKYFEYYEECENKSRQRIEYLSNHNHNISLISYLYLGQVRDIIKKEWESLFYVDFKNVNSYSNWCKNIVNQKLFEVEVLRNTLSHAQPISKQNYDQLAVNINFFKQYIKQYDDKLFMDKKSNDEGLLLEKLNEVKELIVKNKPIDQRLLVFITQPHLKNNIIELSMMPHTRDIKNSPKYCEIKQLIISELNEIIGEYNV